MKNALGSLFACGLVLFAFGVAPAPAQQTPAGGKEFNAEVEAMLKIGVPEGADAPVERGDASERLPNVLLIGDSIAGGYLGGVQSRLKAVAHVERGNSGGTTQNGLESIERILGEREWDVIHFNWGLHDMTWQRRMKPEERGIEGYAARLEQLVTRLRETKAKLVWATTTPWPENNYAYYEQRFGEKLLYSPAEEQQWRNAAIAVIEKHQIPVNDLHALLKPDLETYQKTDDVHFNRDGSRAMADQIAKVVLAMLPQAQEDRTGQ